MVLLCHKQMKGKAGWKPKELYLNQCRPDILTPICGTRGGMSKQNLLLLASSFLINMCSCVSVCVRVDDEPKMVVHALWTNISGCSHIIHSLTCCHTNRNYATCPEARWTRWMMMNCSQNVFEIFIHIWCILGIGVNIVHKKTNMWWKFDSSFCTSSITNNWNYDRRESFLIWAWEYVANLSLGL